MKIKYKREMKHNYMILEPEEIFCDSFEVRMMMTNCIEGLLKFHVKQVDEKKFYYYEITSKQPLSRLLETTYLDAERLQCLIMGIARTLDHMEAYLLGEGQILLEPEYIYVEPGEFQVSLCLVPGLQHSFPQELSKLLQYLLGRVDHQDKECVVMAYGLYQESLKENYGMEDLLRLIGRTCQAGKPLDEDNIERDIANPYQERKMEVTERNANTEREVAEEKWEGTRTPDNTVRLKRYAGLLGAVIFGIPFVVWLFWGMGAIRTYGFLILCTDGAAILGSAALAIFHRGGRRDEKQSASKYLMDPASTMEPVHSLDHRGNYESKPCDSGTKLLKARQSKNSFSTMGTGSLWQMEFVENESEPLFETPTDSENNTILLTGSMEEEAPRCLRFMDRSQGDIPLTYFPFLIGKQEGLVDYVLAKDGVSRLHVRIDQKGEDYWITDLNSTNGTTVAGKHLESNETIKLHPGDEVYIANIGFIFT